MAAKDVPQAILREICLPEGGTSGSGRILRIRKLD
jgi:hypothetical protein